MKHKFAALFVFVLIAVLLLAGCSGGATSPAPRPTAGPSATPPASITASKALLLDPALAESEDAKAVVGYIYEGLVKLENGEPAIGLASTTNVSEDGLEYTFVLRPGVTFHDGTPLNADAVVANFNRWFDPNDPLRGTGPFNAWSNAFGGFKGEMDGDKPKSNFDGIEKVDSMTVIAHLNAPDADFLTKLSDPAFAIASPDALKAAGFGTKSGVDGGTGPYRIGTWTDTSLTLEPNPSYWDAAAIPTAPIVVNFTQ